MKNKARLQSANLFFVELMCVLLFFAISAAVILQVFVAADNKQKLGSLTEKAMICAQSVAESYSVSGNISETVKLVFGEETDIAAKDAMLVLDKDMSVSEDGIVTLRLYEFSETAGEAGRLSRLQMDFTVGDTALFSLCCCAYIPEMRGAADE